MTKNEILAIRVLPPEYVADGTNICTFNGSVIAYNGVIPLPPIQWAEKGPESCWTLIRFKEVPVATKVEEITSWTGAEN